MPSVFVSTPLDPTAPMETGRTPAVTLVVNKQPNATHEQWFDCFFGDKKSCDKWCDNAKTLASRAHNDDSKMIVVFYDVDMPAMMQCKSLNYEKLFCPNSNFRFFNLFLQTVAVKNSATLPRM
jgi:hypothetical protein